jgi:hypothetical protein
VDHVKSTGAEQLCHLAELPNSSRPLQYVNGATGVANNVRKATDFADREELGTATLRIVMSCDVSQQSFEPARLQRQADMAHSQRANARRGGIDSGRCGLSDF